MKGRSIYTRFCTVEWISVQATWRHTHLQNDGWNSKMLLLLMSAPLCVAHHPSHTVPWEMNPAEQMTSQREAQPAVAVLVSPAKLRPHPHFCWIPVFVVQHGRRWLFNISDIWWSCTGNEGFFMDPNAPRPAISHVFAALIKNKYMLECVIGDGWWWW